MDNQKLESSTNYCFYKISDSVLNLDNPSRFIEAIKEYSKIKNSIFLLSNLH